MSYPNLLVIPTLLLGLLTLAPKPQAKLIINIQNVQPGKGQIVVELYDSEASWLDKPLQNMRFPAEQSQQQAAFSLPYGAYAISIYQDVNENGELDRNFIGIPKEPVGFGNNHKPLGEPKFKAARVTFSASAKSPAISLYEVF